ncbi:MAG: hypothetical protein H0V17_31695 [Deltaproteobacteria bacterium]|nr:hypothetical protein [Deltaproteobacteria bacterium]
MAHDIEAAKSGRSACATCGEKINKGEVRVAELYQDATVGRPQYEEHYRGDGNYSRSRSEHREAIQRFHHLQCAVDKHPALVKTALNRAHDSALIEDRAALEKQLAESLDGERKQRVAAATARLAAPVETAAADPNLDPLMEQLAETPEDPELIGIVGDLYQSRNDPRGELISIQLATRNLKRERGPEIGGARTRSQEAEDPTARTMVQRRDELMAFLTPRLDSADRSVWGLGFVRRLELGLKSASHIEELAGLWTHPSLRVISELRLELPAVADDAQVISHLATLLPKSLRKLEIGGSSQNASSLQPLIAALPRLQELVLLSRRGDPAIAHDKLSKITLHGGAYAETLALLVPKKLEAVKELAIRDWGFIHDPFAAFARSKWKKAIDRLHIDEPAKNTMTDNPPLPMEMVDALREGLGKHKLPRLEITGVAIPLPVRAALAKLCVELVCPAASVVLDDATTHVTHANKPEWGRGKIVKRHDGKLEVKFGKEVKVFKADAPFLVPAVDD